VRPGV